MSDRVLRFPVSIICCLVLVVSAANVLAQECHRTDGVLLQGTEHEIHWYSIEAPIPGETVLVLGGVHGNEPAGAMAASQISGWSITRGRLIIIPRLNRLGLAANTRWLPAHREDRDLRDLNRNFPRTDQPEPRTEIAEAVWGFVVTLQPDWVFDLHEGYDFHSTNPKSVGSSVITFPDQSTFGRTLVHRANSIESTQLPFSLLARTGPVNGSIARACSTQLGAKAFIIESTTRGQPLSLRIRQHREMVAQALLMIGIVEIDQSDDMLPSESTEEQRHIAIEDDQVGIKSTLYNRFGPDHQLEILPFGRHDDLSELKPHVDMLIFPWAPSRIPPWYSDQDLSSIHMQVWLKTNELEPQSIVYSVDAE